MSAQLKFQHFMRLNVRLSDNSVVMARQGNVRSFSDLPGEVVVRIFSCLDTESLKNVRLVSRFEMIEKLLNLHIYQFIAVALKKL